MDLELGNSGPWVRVRHGPEMHILAPNCWSGNTYPKTFKLVAGKNGEWEILENLVHSFSFRSHPLFKPFVFFWFGIHKLARHLHPVNWKYCCARPIAAPRNGRRDNVEGIMITWGTSPPPILQIHSLHQVATGTPSHVPLQRRAMIIAIYRGFGNALVLGPIVWSPQTGTRHWNAFLVPISHLFNWTILQFCGYFDRKTMFPHQEPWVRGTPLEEHGTNSPRGVLLLTVLREHPPVGG